jgi:hypothetical protein
MIEISVDKRSRQAIFRETSNFQENMMDGEQIKDMVRSHYAAVAVGNAGCCGPAATPQQASCEMGYSEAELASVPEGANLVSNDLSVETSCTDFSFTRGRG